MDPVARLLAGLAVAAAFVAGAPTAAADTFFVDDSGDAGATDCRTQGGTKCQTITQAIGIANGIAGTGDIISVGPGTYEEFVTVSGAAAQGMRIVGAGRTSNPADSTVIKRPVNNGFVHAATLGDGTITGLGLSNVFISVPAALGTGNGGGLQVKSPGTEIENVAVSVQFAGLAPGVLQDTSAPGTTLDTVSVSGLSGWTGYGIQSSASFTLLDSTVTARSGYAVVSGDVDGGGPNTVVVRRSRISNNADAASRTVAIDGANTTIDSSLVFGGAETSVHTRGAQAPTTVRLRGVTIDPGAPGFDADPSVFAYATGTTAGQVQQAFVESSLLIGKVEAGFLSSITCTNSDVPLTQTADVACHLPGGNSFTSPPDSLFADMSARNYAPVAGSPSVDTGSSSAPQSGDSTIDLAGAARIVDGNLNCVARIDKGAFELTGQSASCPTGGGPAGGTGAKGATGAKDTTAPRATLAGARSQDPLKQKGVLFVDVTPTEDGTATTAGTVSIPGASKSFKLKGSRKAVRKGRKSRLRLRISKKTLRLVRRALRKGSRINARVTVTLRDAAGNRRPAKRTIRLRAKG